MPARLRGRAMPSLAVTSDSPQRARPARPPRAGPAARSLIAGFIATPFGPRLHPPGAPATYPLAWRLKVPAAGLELSLGAIARHQFVTMQILPSFWEGAAAIVHGPRGVCTVENSREAP